MLGGGLRRSAHSASPDTFTVALPNADIQLIPLAVPSGDYPAILEPSGPGVHRLVWRVDDLDGLVADFVHRGVPMLDPVEGPGGLRSILIDPSVTYGALVELRSPDGEDADEEQLGIAPARGTLHHIAIAVADGPPAHEFFRSFLGGSTRGPSRFGDFMAVTLLPSEPFLGFIYPLANGDQRAGFVARFVDDHGPGPHHLAFEMADIDAALAAAVARGTRLVNRAPAEGPVNDVFLHHTNPTGTLLRLQRGPVWT